jgi:hypothetical protein
MKFKKIVGFGDSWIYGDELLDPTLTDEHYCSHLNTSYRLAHCFLGQLGKHYGVPTENFGIPGGSLQSTMWTFQWWLDHEACPEQCLVLAGLTDSDRISHYNPNHVHYSNDPPWNKFVHSSWVDFGSTAVSREFTDLIKRQVVLTNCEELYRLNYQQTVLTLDGVAARRSIPMMQFNIMPGARPVDHAPTLIWPNWSMTTWFRDMPQNQNREMIKPNGHPNEAGHTLIRDRLISQIDSCIM